MLKTNVQYQIYRVVKSTVLKIINQKMRLIETTSLSLSLSLSLSQLHDIHHLVWEVFPVTIIFQSIYTDYAYFDKKNN
jgi:hypothetical protein